MQDASRAPDAVSRPRVYRVTGSRVGATPDSGQPVTRPSWAIRLFRIRPEKERRMSDYWCPYFGHPDGASDTPWFRVVDGRGYRTDGNPAGPSEAPTFRIIDGFAYPTLSMPVDAPTFEVIGQLVYTAAGAAWFRIEKRNR